MSAVGVPADTAIKPPKWQITKRQWIFVVLVFVGIILADVSYEYFNTYNPVDRWPAFYAWDPDTGQLVQPLTGEHPYQTFILRSWLDEKVPFIPLFAIPYLSALVIWHLVVTLLTLAFGTFRRFLTLGFAFITSQLLMDLAFYLFQTNVLRDDVTVPGGFGGWLIHTVWGNDMPFNNYPSGHCTWTTIAIIALWRLRKRIPKTSWILMIWLLLVFPATVILRQHYLMDVYAGILLGFTCYWACMFVIERPKLVGRDELAAMETPRT